MKVSIIIPIYNTGEYLKPCVDSVLKQTYKDIEVLLIDDGSEEQTAAICDELAIVDPRVKVHHTPNQGVSKARNTGIKFAQGDILCFVDSDDTILPCMIQILVEALIKHKAQIAMCDATTIRPGQPDESDTIPDLPQSCLLQKKDITPAMLSRLAGSAWRCAYMRTDMHARQAFFPEGLKFSEDRIFNLIAMGLAEKIVYLKEPYYMRLIRPGSACYRFYPDMTEQIVKMRSVLLPIVEKYWGKEYLEAYNNQIAGHIGYAVTNYTAPTNKLNLKKQLKEIKNLTNTAEIKKTIEDSHSTDLRARLIKGNRYILLTLIGRATNIFHKLWKRGQYRQ